MDLSSLIDLLHIEYLIYLLALLGLCVVICYAIDNLKSVLMIIKSILDPYFQPQLDLTLAERFGSWAGKFRKFHFMNNFDYPFPLLNPIDFLPHSRAKVSPKQLSNNLCLQCVINYPEI